MILEVCVSRIAPFDAISHSCLIKQGNASAFPCLCNRAAKGFAMSDKSIVSSKLQLPPVKTEQILVQSSVSNAVQTVHNVATVPLTLQNPSLSLNAQGSSNIVFNSHDVPTHSTTPSSPQILPEDLGKSEVINQDKDSVAVAGRTIRNKKTSENTASFKYMASQAEQTSINACPDSDFFIMLSYLIVNPIVIVSGGSRSIYDRGVVKPTFSNVNPVSSAIELSQQPNHSFIVSIQVESENRITNYTEELTDKVEVLDFLIEHASEPSIWDRKNLIPMFKKTHHLQELKTRASMLITSLMNKKTTSEYETFCKEMKVDFESTSIYSNFILLQEFFDLLYTSEIFSLVVMPVVRNIGIPAGERLKKLTLNIIKHFPKETSLHNYAIYINILTRLVPEHNTSDFKESLRTIIFNFNYHEEASEHLINLFSAVRDVIYKSIPKTFSLEKCQPALKFIFSRISQVINDIDMPELNKDLIMVELRPIISLQKNSFIKSKNIDKALQEIIRIDKKNYCCVYTKNKVTRDIVITRFIANAMVHPLHCLLPISQNFESDLESGHDGQLPLATIELISLSYINISRERGKEIFTKLFNQNVKDNKKTNGIIILFINGHHPDAIGLPINDPPEKDQLITIFMNYWSHYKKLEHEPNFKDQPVIIDKKMQDILATSESTLSPRDTEKWVEKCKDLEVYIFSEGKVDNLLTAILTVPMKDEEKMQIADEIITANSGTLKRSSLIMLVSRLKNIISSTPPGSTSFFNLIDMVSLIQVKLIEKLKKNPSLTDDLIENISHLEKAAGIMHKLKIIHSYFDNGDIDINWYQNFIIKLINTSFANSYTSIRLGQIKKTAAINFICQNMKKSNKLNALFQVFDNVNLHLTIDSMEFSWFTELAATEIVAHTISPADREAFGKFLTSTLNAWWSLEKAYQINYGKNDNLYLEWVLIPDFFLSAPTDVQSKMLKFHTSMQLDCSDFLQRCLSGEQQPKSSATPHSKRVSEITLRVISDFLQTDKPDDFLKITFLIFDSLSNLKKPYSTVDRSLINSLGGLLKKIDANTEEYKHLSARLELFKQVSPTTNYQTPTFTDTSEDHKITNYMYLSGSDSTSGTNKNRTKHKIKFTTPSTSASESATDTPSGKTVLMKKIYIIKDREKLHSDPNVIIALDETLKLFSTNSQAKELHFHLYKNKEKLKIFGSLDVKVTTPPWNYDKQSGRSNCRALVVNGGNSEYLLLGIGSHDQIRSLFKNFSKIYTEKDKVKEAIMQLINDNSHEIYMDNTPEAGPA